LKKHFPYRYRVLIFLFTLLFITYLDRICIGILGVRIKSEFHLNNAQWGWVTAAFSLSYAIFEIPSGILGDLKGQKAVLIRIVLFWSLFTALTGATVGLLSLVIVRFLFGMGEAGAVPNTSGVLSRWLPKSEMSRGIAISFAGQPMGAAFAPLIVVPLAVAFGWRIPFFVNGFIGFLWVLLIIAWFRNNPSEMKGISEQEKNLIEENRQISSHKTNIPWKRIIKSRSLILVSLIHFISQWSNYFFIAWLAIYLQEGRHFLENSMKLITFFVFIPSILVSYNGGLIADRLNQKKGLKFGRRFVGAFCLGSIGLTYVTESITTNNLLLIACLVIGYIFQMLHATASFGVCADISGNHCGTVAAIMNTFGQIGAFFMSIFFGKIVDITGNYNAPLFVIAGLLFTGSVLWFMVDPTKKLILEESTMHVEEGVFS
jgi:MFS family permease